MTMHISNPVHWNDTYNRVWQRFQGEDWLIWDRSFGRNNAGSATIVCLRPRDYNHAASIPHVRDKAVTAYDIIPRVLYGDEFYDSYVRIRESYKNALDANDSPT